MSDINPNAVVLVAFLTVVGALLGNALVGLAIALALILVVELTA